MRRRLIFVVDLEHQVEPLKTIRAPIRNEVAGQERVVVGPSAQQMTGSLALNANDLFGHVHNTTVSAAGLRR